MKLIQPRLPVLGLLARSAVIPAVLLATSNMAMVMFAPAVHLAVVGSAGTLAAMSAVSMSIIAARRNDGRAVWIGMAFSVIATLLIIHGLATPGVILPDNAVVQVAGALNLPVCGAILAASGLPILRRPRPVKLLLAVQLCVVAALAVAGAAALVFSPDISVVPDPSTVAANLIVVVGAIPLGLLAWRAGRTYLLTRRVSDLIVVEGIVWLIGAQDGLINFTMTDAAWWSAHLLEFAGIAMVAVPVALDLRQAVASRRWPSPSVRSSAFPEGRLRELALGGLLHDVGKLSVPTEILSKPGRLTDEEFDEIRRHPGAGRDLLAELGGFSPLVLDLVESHHERIDGNGYPNRRPAGELAIEVRILTVADVYDALTADRVYREAWPAERALALLDDETGLAFDPDCVTALRSVVAPERPDLSPAPAPREPEAAPMRGLRGTIFGEAAA